MLDESASDRWDKPHGPPRHAITELDQQFGGDPVFAPRAIRRGDLRNEPLQVGRHSRAAWL
jgi:hypothetical protein